MKRNEIIKILKNSLPPEVDAEYSLSRLENFKGVDHLTYEELREFEKQLLKDDNE